VSYVWGDLEIAQCSDWACSWMRTWPGFKSIWEQIQQFCFLYLCTQSRASWDMTYGTRDRCEPLARGHSALLCTQLKGRLQAATLNCSSAVCVPLCYVLHAPSHRLRCYRTVPLQTATTKRNKRDSSTSNVRRLVLTKRIFYFLVLHQLAEEQLKEEESCEVRSFLFLVPRIRWAERLARTHESK
jgi:hypothetical protein